MTTFKSLVEAFSSLGDEEPLAREFARQLRRKIGAANLRRAAIANASEGDPGICHSHDYCDANMVMMEAWNSIVDHEYRFGNRQDMDLWNRAWNRAKMAGFWK